MTTQLLELQELSILVSIYKDLTSGSSPYTTPGATTAVLILDKMIGKKADRIARISGLNDE